MRCASGYMLENPVVSRTTHCGVRPDVYSSDNVTSAGNQQERLLVEAIPSSLGSFLSGFALGEGSFMIVCRKRGDYAGSTIVYSRGVLAVSLGADRKSTRLNSSH